MQSILIYGGSSTGKTSLVGQFAKYQFHRHRGRPTLYVGADSGWESAIDEVRAGYMIPYNLATHNNPPWALRRIANGMWPTGIDPDTGAALDPSDKGFRDIRELGLQISGIAVEGITRINQLLSGTMTNDLQLSTQEPLTAQFRLRHDRTIVQGNALQFAATPDEESYSMASRGTYKWVQEQTLDYVTRFKAHPYAPRLLMTAHQGEGKTSEGVTARCLGPLIYGKAGVADVPGWFSTYFHVETIPEGTFGPGTPEMRALWFRHHIDRHGSGLQWPSKLGASAKLTFQFRQHFKDGYIPAWIDADGLKGGLIDFLSAYDFYERPSGPDQSRIIEIGQPVAQAITPPTQQQITGVRR